MRRGILFLLFFLSGASALVYELVWQRLLHLVFGVSTLATSAVLAAFMGGLALGVGLIRKRRWAPPLILAASWMGLIVGLFAVVIWAFRAPQFIAGMKQSMSNVPAGTPAPPPVFINRPSESWTSGRKSSRDHPVFSPC